MRAWLISCETIEPHQRRAVLSFSSSRSRSRAVRLRSSQRASPRATHGQHRPGFVFYYAERCVPPFRVAEFGVDLVQLPLDVLVHLGQLQDLLPEAVPLRLHDLEFSLQRHAPVKVAFAFGLELRDLGVCCLGLLAQRRGAA
jgi:hypothetical protein